MNLLLWGTSFVIGVFVASVFGFPHVLFILFACAGALLIGGAFLDRRFLLSVVIIFGFLLGVARADSGPFKFSFLAPFSHPLETVRISLESNISQAFPEPHASYLRGLLVGVRSTLPQSLKKAFAQTGTSHLIALSGYNVSIIADNLNSLFGSFRFSILGILIFILATGASSSVVRAGIMGILALFARRYGHVFSASRALLIAVGIMVFVNPPILLGDIGFQLSVLATFGLIVLSGPIAKRLTWLPQRFGFREAASATLAAEIFTLPLILYYFGGFSIFAPVANILVLVTIPATMFFGFVAALMGYASSTLAPIAAWPAYLLLSYQLAVINFFAGLGF